MARLYVDPHNFVDLEAAKPHPLEIASRAAAFDFVEALGVLPNPDPILKAERKDITVYESLLADAHVGAVVDSLVDGVKALEWDVDRGKAKSRHAKSIIEWLRDFDLHSFIEACVNARLYGYQPLEIMWTQIGDLWVPTEAVAKPPTWFGWDNAGVLRFRTKGNENEGIPLDPYPRKFLVPRYRATYVNPYGSGVLARCFWPVAFKKGGMRFWVTFIEKFGMPHVVIKVPQSATDAERSTLLDMGRKMIQDAVAVINDTDNLELIESKNTSANSDLFAALVSHANDEISKAIKSETLTTEVGDTGSYAAAQTHAGVSATGIQSVKNLVVRYVNIIVDWYMEVNVGPGVQPPRVIPFQQEDVDKDLAERDATLVGAGVKFTRNYWMRAYGFEEEDIEEEVAGDIAPAGGAAAGATAAGATAAGDANPGAQGAEDDPQDFAEGEATFPDQAAVDALFARITPETMQLQMEAIMQPVLDLVANARSYDDVARKLAATFPDMPTGDFEEYLAKVIWLGEIAGRIAVQNEVRDAED